MNKHQKLQEELTAHLAQGGIVITAENIIDFTEEQFAEIRHTGFGASDSSNILGVNPFPGGTAEELLHQKIHKISNDEIGKKATVRMGKDLEDLIIRKFEEATGKTIIKPIHMYGIPKIGLNTNFDGVLKEGKEFIPAEVKTISMYGRKHYDFTYAIDITPSDEDPIEALKNMIARPLLEALDTVEETIVARAKDNGIPPYYYTQLQQQIAFTCAPFGYLVTMDVRDWKVRVHKILRDQLVIDQLYTSVEKLNFKLSVANGTFTVEEDDTEL